MSYSVDQKRIMEVKGLLASAAITATLAFSAHAQEEVAPTFSEHVAPILQQSCQQCHNPSGVGPMSLMTYEEVRPFSMLIKDRVEKRIMPPWHLDKNIGIQQYKNDISLSDQEISTIVAWAEAGAPQGDSALMPEPMEFPSGDAWQLESEMGPPDLVVRSSPYDVIANGQDQWWEPRVEFDGLDEERWLKAAEFKPSYPMGQKVVHHGHAVLIPEGDTELGSRPLARYGVGKSWEVFPDGVGLRIPENGTVAWNLHYFPVGEEAPQDVVEVGLWFYEKGQEPAMETAGEQLFRVDGRNGTARGQDILIPPHGYQVLQGTYVLDDPAELHSFRPHLHMRGKVMTMEAIYPDGKQELLSQVNKYDHNWQIAYLYEDHVKPLLPKGTVLRFTSVFDNTADNPINPDPDQWVAFGRRGVDEMSHAWVGVTYLNEEEYQQARQRREAQNRTLDFSSEE